jgi:hypothetical protein
VRFGNRKGMGVRDLTKIPLEEVADYAAASAGVADNTAQHKAGMAEFARRQTQAQIDAAEFAKRNTRYMLWSVIILTISSVATLAVTIGVAIWKP